MVERTLEKPNRNLERGQFFEASNRLVPLIRAANAALGEDRPFIDFDLVDPVRDRITESFIKEAPSAEEARAIVESLEVAIDEDEYWFNWADGDREVYTLRVNMNERHSDKLTRGKAEAMALHEIVGHFAQMINWQRAIDRGRLAPVLGLTSVVNPEPVTDEGVAETLHYYVPKINELLSPEARYELEVEGLRQMIYNNVHTKITSDKIEKEEVLGIVKEFYPAETELEAVRQFEERKDDPVKKAYLYAYGIGYLAHRYFAEILDRDGRRSLLRLIYRQPLTPGQVKDYAFKLSDNPDNLESGANGKTKFLSAA